MPTEMESRKTAGFVQQLVWHEQDGDVVVTPREEDRFLVKLHRAIEGLKLVAKADEFARQFRLLTRVIAEWLKDNPSAERAYLTLRDGMFSLVVVRNAVEYDEAFEDELSRLDIAIANDVDLDLIRTSSVALPKTSNEAFASFLNPEFTVEIVHGASGGPHPSGQQESRSA